MSVAVGRALGVAAIAGALAGGCGPRNFANENDSLRREREDLRARVAALELELVEARAIGTGSGTGSGALDPAEVALATSRCAGVRVDRLSGFRTEANLDQPETLMVRLRTVDGRGRFTQVVGSMVVRADRVRAGEPAVELGSVSLGPAAVRDAFRSGLGGYWYAVEVPVPQGVGGPGDGVAVGVVLTLESGETVEDVRILEGLWDRWAIGRTKSQGPPNTR